MTKLRNDAVARVEKVEFIKVSKSNRVIIFIFINYAKIT